MRRRVVITGMGAITPLGDTVEGMFDALLEGRSGVGPITHFDARTFPTRFAAEVRNFDLARYLPTAGSRWTDASLAAQFAAAASHLALADSGLRDDDAVDRTRFGVYLGCGEGEQDFPTLIGMAAAGFRPERQAMDEAAQSRYALDHYHRGREYRQEMHNPAADIAEFFALEGPNLTNLTACAAGTQAVGEALELIRCGDADLMLTGGAHSMIYPLGVTGFNLLTALSTRNDAPQAASRPFDRTRDGFVLGEGAGIVILEELEHAKKRGAAIHAELTGYGCSGDAYRVTDCHPEGRGAATCMSAAIKDARLSPAEIGYINAHGTSTKVNDLAETLAIKKVFAEAAYHVPVSSTKSMMGHLIGGAGAVESIICATALLRGWLPPTINYEFPDPACDLDYIPNSPRQKRVRHALSNSFGFGGQNASIIVSRFEG